MDVLCSSAQWTISVSRSLHDIKATHMGGQIRFKAEVDFDGKEITRAYLYKQDLEKLLLVSSVIITIVINLLKTLVCFSMD